jgi:GDP-L-fucose synthase
MKMGTHTDHSICVSGHRGMVGSSIVRRLRALGYQNIITATHATAPVVHRTGSRID